MALTRTSICSIKSYGLTFIFAVVLGSMKDFTVFHSILKPGPALMINMRFKVCIVHNIFSWHHNSAIDDKSSKNPEIYRPKYVNF